MPRQGQRKGDRDGAYKPGKDDEDIVDMDIDEVKPTKATIKPAKVTKPFQKGVSKQQSQKGSLKSTPKGTPKGTPRSTPKPPAAGAYKKPSPPPNTSTAAPSSTTIKTPSPSDSFFCCHHQLPLPSSFPPALENFYSFLVKSLTTKFPPSPLESIPQSTTYYRFSHLSLTTFTEMHRFFLSLDPRNEAGELFVEGSEENVLRKAGALVALDEDGNRNRNQDVMIFTRNGRCEDHMKGGFWYVLMRVEQVVEVEEVKGKEVKEKGKEVKEKEKDVKEKEKEVKEKEKEVKEKENVGIGLADALGDEVLDGVVGVKKNVGVGLGDEVVNEVVNEVVEGVVDGEELDHEIDLDLYT